MSEKKNKKTVQAKPVQSNGFCVYIGPSITGVIQNGAVYRGDKASVLRRLENVVNKYPLVASLVVTDKTLSEDRIKVKTPGNILFVNYKKLLTGKN